jgi:hypothetical protein
VVVSEQMYEFYNAPPETCVAVRIDTPHFDARVMDDEREREMLALKFVRFSTYLMGTPTGNYSKVRNESVCNSAHGSLLFL